MIGWMQSGLEVKRPLLEPPSLKTFPIARGETVSDRRPSASVFHILRPTDVGSFSESAIRPKSTDKVACRQQHSKVHPLVQILLGLLFLETSFYLH